MNLKRSARSRRHATLSAPTTAIARTMGIALTLALAAVHPALAYRPAGLTGRASSARQVNRAGTCRLVHHRYVTLPGFHPVGFCMSLRPAAHTAPGYVLLTPRPSPRLDPGGQFAAMILDDAGRVVWYSPRIDRVHDLKTVRYQGRRLLALFQRRDPGKGYYELLDEHYRVVTRVYVGKGYATDSHEFQVTPRGTAYLDSYHVVKVPGAGRVTDYMVREIDLKTRAVLFEWHALDHVPVSASFVRRPTNGRAWDYFHGNSIEPPEPGGDTILVSSRNTSAVYGIDRSTGAVRWILGGKRDGFGIARHHPDWVFCGQHDARRWSDGSISIFDNGGSGKRTGVGCPVHAARVERFRLDAPRRTVRRVSVIASRRSAPTGAGLFATAVGSARRQPNGDTLVNWGTTGVVTEITPSRRINFALHIEPWTYRAVRSAWVGVPTGRPAVAARSVSGDSIDVWASWNGATQIVRWHVLAGDAPDTLRPVGPAFRFGGLETRMRVRGAGRYVAVRATDSNGRELRRSCAVRVR